MGQILIRFGKNSDGLPCAGKYVSVLEIYILSMLRVYGSVLVPGEKNI